jgi:hypothetical protein
VGQYLTREQILNAPDRAPGDAAGSLENVRLQIPALRLDLDPGFRATVRSLEATGPLLKALGEQQAAIGESLRPAGEMLNREVAWVARATASLFGDIDRIMGSFADFADLTDPLTEAVVEFYDASTREPATPHWGWDTHALYGPPIVAEDVRTRAAQRLAHAFRWPIHPSLWGRVYRVLKREAKSRETTVEVEMRRHVLSALPHAEAPHHSAGPFLPRDRKHPGPGVVARRD